MGTTETITIGKQKIEAKLCELNQADLKFYPENPRVYNVLKFEGSDPTQEEIERYMCSQDHVKQLKVSIESNGGLIDPLMVQDGTMVVLEGNSRLAAYRLLCAKDPIKWGKVKCKLLPKDISEATIFALLGQFHIVGRKDWDPFEQAHYLYRRHKQTQIPIEAMAQELGITKQKAEKWAIDLIRRHTYQNKSITILNDSAKNLKSQINKLAKSFSKEQILNITCEQFCNDLMLCKGLTWEMVHEYMGYKLIIITDIQFLKNKLNEQDKFFQLLQKLLVEEREIVLSCDDKIDNILNNQYLIELIRKHSRQ